jgi:hypothetical protein
MLKKLISVMLAVVLISSMAISASAEIVIVGEINLGGLSLTEPCEQLFSTATLDDDFCDSSVIIVMNRNQSRENRSFTARDFSDIGAVYVEGLMELDDEQSVHAERLWNAEKAVEESAINMPSVSTHFAATQVQHEVFRNEYSEARIAAEEAAPMLNFDEFRQIVLVRLDRNCKENVLNVIRQLQMREYILFAGVNSIDEPDSDYEYESFSETFNTNSTSLSVNFTLLWNMQRISLTQAWEAAGTQGNPAVRVGTLGRIIDGTHDDLKNRVFGTTRTDGTICGRATVPNPIARSEQSWGTTQAGIIGAAPNSSSETVGVAPGVHLYSLGMNNHGVDSTISHRVRGVGTATRYNVRILNHSWGRSSSPDGRIALLNAVRGYNGLFVSSAGNANVNYDNDPWLQLSNVIIVGATNSSTTNEGRSMWTRHHSPYRDCDDCVSTDADPTNNFRRCVTHRCGYCGLAEWCSASNYGINGVHIFAPATVQTTRPHNTHGEYGGTSSSAPHVAGVAALLYSWYYERTLETTGIGRFPRPEEVKWAIIEGGIESILIRLH